MPDGSRYDEDFYQWTRDQSKRLRAAASARSNLDLDWANLAEEIESVGNSDRRELRSRLTFILEHLLKLRYSPADQPRIGLRETVRRERFRVELVLEDSPSLRPQVASFTAGVLEEAVRRTISSLIDHGEACPSELSAPERHLDLMENVLASEFFPEHRQ